MIRNGFAALLALHITSSLAPSVAFGLDAEPVAQPSILAIEAVQVTPESPAADTLCHLTIQVRNLSEKTVTALGFRVEVGGQELPVYQHQLYLQSFPPKAVTELRLYNFWTSETGRPAPADGVLPLKISLREARFVTIDKAANGDETWQLGDAVAGLPVVAERTLKLVKPKA